MCRLENLSYPFNTLILKQPTALRHQGMHRPPGSGLNSPSVTLAPSLVSFRTFPAFEAFLVLAYSGHRWWCLRGEYLEALQQYEATHTRKVRSYSEGCEFFIIYYMQRCAERLQPFRSGTVEQGRIFRDMYEFFRTYLYNPAGNFGLYSVHKEATEAPCYNQQTQQSPFSWYNFCG